MLSLQQQIELLVNDYGNLTRDELGRLLVMLGFTDKFKINETLWYMAADGIIKFDKNWQIVNGDNIPAD